MKAVKKVLRILYDRLFERRVMSSLPQDVRVLIKEIKRNNLTYLPVRKLVSIANTCRSQSESMMPGIIIEAGCALGGSSILIASLKPKSKSLLIYDVFGMIPPPSASDTRDVHARYDVIVSGRSRGIGGDKYYGYEENLMEVVLSNFSIFNVDRSEHSVTLIKGLVQETLEVTQPVAFAHIDVDWYEPVRVCLERIFPRLVPGGVIILDDYHDWGGCRKATDEYLETVTGQYCVDDASGSLKIIKK